MGSKREIATKGLESYVMLLIACIFLHSLYQPTNALNTIRDKYQTPTCFSTGMSSPGIPLEQRNPSPAHQSHY